MYSMKCYAFRIVFRSFSSRIVADFKLLKVDIIYFLLFTRQLFLVAYESQESLLLQRELSRHCRDFLKGVCYEQST